MKSAASRTSNYCTVTSGLASFALNCSICLSKRNFFRRELSNFHRLNCRVLLRSYYFDLPLEKDLFSF